MRGVVNDYVNYSTFVV